MVTLAILASGSGTNAENIIKYFNKKNSEIIVNLIISNNKEAYVLKRAENLHVKSLVMNKSELGHCSDNSYDNNSPKILDILINEKIDYIILAGYLLKIPEILIQKYPDKIINIHPALLPKYGGKGMYGDRVHKAVIAANERESGITIHVVNEVYDSGKILFQDKCIIDPSDTPEDLAAKIHVLEQKNFPKVIEKYILSKEQ